MILLIGDQELLKHGMRYWVGSLGLKFLFLAQWAIINPFINMDPTTSHILFVFIMTRATSIMMAYDQQQQYLKGLITVSLVKWPLTSRKIIEEAANCSVLTAVDMAIVSVSPISFAQ
jgi:hypothetical protein